MTAADERVANDGFWVLHIPKPWPPGIAREIAQHDHGAAEPQPQPVDVAGMDMTEYVRDRDRLGVRDTGDFLGIGPSPAPKPIERNS